MGDIKAKDLNTAGSIAAGDKILGSSINGTTANVTVETLENHAIDTKKYASLSDKTVSGSIVEIKNSIASKTTLQRIHGEPDYTQANTWTYTGLSLTAPSGHTYLAYATCSWSHGQPTGLAFSISQNNLSIISFTEVTTGISAVYGTPAVIIPPGQTVFLFEKKSGTGKSDVNLYYIDLNA